jgi:hypothetical protein
MYLSSTAAARLDRRGVALPIALLGLVVVSLMVTAALLTSSTELALSHAHSDGTRSLYHSDAALEGFVAERAQWVANGGVGLRPDTTYSYTLPGAGAFAIDVSRLSQQQESPSTTRRKRTEVFSLLTVPPGDRGRRVGAFVKTTKEWTIIDNNIEEGVATGGAIVNSGNSKISASSSICQNPAGSNTAVRFTNDVSQSDKAKLDMTKIDGDTATLTGVSSADLIRHALGGATRDDIKASASIKFGYDGLPAYDESKKPSSSTYADTSRYHWGCPAKVVTCDSPSDTLKVPSIAIDARGKTIGLQGDHGQGILYVFNGNLKITGKFIFFGAIIIDGGHFEVAGTGTDGTKIEGSLIASGGVKDSRISGDAVVNYNSCAVAAAENAFNQNAEQNAPQVLDPATYAWYEVIR